MTMTTYFLSGLYAIEKMNKEISLNDEETSYKLQNQKLIIIILNIVILICVILDINLVLFHIYLTLTGQSTYSFIKARKQKNSTKIAQ